jgi:hypothetical protein
MNSRALTLFGAGSLLLLPNIAFAQTNDELHASPNNGVSITSNADNSNPGQEFFSV